MDRQHLRNQRTAVRGRGIDLTGRTAAASALATGCLAVVALWRSATTNAAAGDGARR